MYSAMYTGVGAIALLYLLALLAVPFLLVLLAVWRLTDHCVRALFVFRRRIFCDPAPNELGSAANLANMPRGVTASNAGTMHA